MSSHVDNSYTSQYGLGTRTGGGKPITLRSISQSDDVSGRTGVGFHQRSGTQADVFVGGKDSESKEHIVQPLNWGNAVTVTTDITVQSEGKFKRSVDMNRSRSQDSVQSDTFYKP